jgi:hypothetical protein
MSEDHQREGPADEGRPTRETLNSAVLRRRADQAFYLRLRDIMEQHHRVLERLGR